MMIIKRFFYRFNNEEIIDSRFLISLMFFVTSSLDLRQFFNWISNLIEGLYFEKTDLNMIFFFLKING